MTEKLNKALSLFETSKRLRTHVQRYKEITSPSNVDKHQNAFVVGSSDRFCSQQFSMYLKCYKGFYGDSSCSTIALSSTPQEVQEAFVSWANKNMQLILDGIAEEIESKAQSLKFECKQELDDALERFSLAFGTQDVNDD